ncbi:spore cortex biosynthesis protein [Gracilibacillus halophilus YIM-C55.5]|uniref:Spore cortex biosynthesis protein n=2 Tax=Gracilibacillus TaxID=74385 RepID=N4WX44_9BACI|nr:spore cortex biosynthesis protein [Gracilibacillus halophilus YIM-C55.5]
MIEIMFWLVQAAFIYFILYKVNEGVLRIYVFLSLFCGYAMFKALFEQAYQRINNMMFYWVHALYTFVSRIIFYCVVKPIQLVLSVLLLLLTAIYRTIVYLVNVIRTIFTLLAKWMWAIIKVLIPKKILHFFYFILKKYSKIIRKKN